MWSGACRRSCSEVCGLPVTGERADAPRRLGALIGGLTGTHSLQNVFSFRADFQQSFDIVNIRVCPDCWGAAARFLQRAKKGEP